MKEDLRLIGAFILMFLLGFFSGYFEGKPEEDCFVIPPPEATATATAISITTLRPIP